MAQVYTHKILVQLSACYLGCIMKRCILDILQLSRPSTHVPIMEPGSLQSENEPNEELLEFIDWVMEDCEALRRDNRLLSITLDILNKPSCKIVEQWVIQIDTQYQQDDPPSAFGAMIEKIQLDQVLEIALRDKAVVPGNERDISIMLGTLPCHTNGLDTKYIRNIFYTTDMMKVSCSTVQEC